MYVHVMILHVWAWVSGYGYIRTCMELHVYNTVPGAANAGLRAEGWSPDLPLYTSQAIYIYSCALIL